MTLLPAYIVTADTRYTLEESVLTPQLWRVVHRTDIINLPNVQPFEPNHYTDFGRSFQLLEKSLNPTMIDTRWHNLHLGGNQGNDATAFNNRQGFEMDGDPRVDFVNGKYLGAPLPKQEALCCGGTILAQRSIDNQYLYPEYVDGLLPAPSLEYIKARPWLYFDAVTVDRDVNGNVVIRRFPQGKQSDGTVDRVYILLLASKPIRILLTKVTKIPKGSPLPSPYQYP
jgi:hypothetical protein